MNELESRTTVLRDSLAFLRKIIPIRDFSMAKTLDDQFKPTGDINVHVYFWMFDHQASEEYKLSARVLEFNLPEGKTVSFLLREIMRTYFNNLDRELPEKLIETLIGEAS